MSSVKKMEKGEATFHDFRGEPYTVMKFFWMCRGCGLVWQTRTEAGQCENRGHKPFYQRVYGVTAIVNDRPVGGYVATFNSIRRENNGGNK